MTSTNSSTGLLVLFDIDGTLVKTGDVRHRYAFATGLREYFGLEWPPRHRELDYAGMVDTQILSEVLRANGGLTDGHRALFPAALARMGEAYVRSRQGTRIAVLPGVRELLRALRRRGVHLALATGNIQAVAWGKLRRARLNGYFETGGFGDDCDTRDGLVPVAIGRVESRTQRRFDPRRVVVIGDTPRDVACAEAAGVRMVAVATGKYDIPTLREAGAPAVVPNLSDTRALVELVAG